MSVSLDDDMNGQGATPFPTARNRKALLKMAY